MANSRTTVLVARSRAAVARALRALFERVRRLTRPGPESADPDPEVPVLIVGRARPYLDVRWLVEDAEGHLAADFADGALDPWDVACYDRRGRPLDVGLRADATVRLSVSGAAPDPVALRDRLGAVCAAARDAHASVPEQDRCDLRDLDLPAGEIPDLAVAMATRFDHVRERPPAVNGDGGHGPGGNGAGGIGPSPAHAGSRLHNFWHAIT